MHPPKIECTCEFCQIQRLGEQKRALEVRVAELESELARSNAAEKPLFIPLRREFYDAFRDGSKTEEFRRHGARWNATTCRVGRPVVLSLGYGKRNRMAGVIAGFEVRHDPTTTDAWAKCFGETNEFTDAACIRIANLKPMEALWPD